MGSIKTSNCVGSCLSWFALVLFFLALVIPCVTFPNPTSSSSSSDCTVATVFLWANAVCASSGSCGTIDPCKDEPSTKFWGKDDDLTNLFAPSFFMLLISTILALVVTIYWSARCCCVKRTPTAINLVCVLLAVLALLLSFIVIVYFAAALPKAFSKSSGFTEGEGPWDTFVGHTTEGNLTRVWAPIGWWFLVLGWPFFLATNIALCLALRKNHEDAGYGLLN
ncbi:hypothetical protein QOT17_008209 [Balamuthia mandrillaris]